jgi:nickel superoxide dismutase
MLKKILFSGASCLFGFQMALFSHCQMPCGIYHDDMVYDQIDQYVETMAKGISVLTEDKFETTQQQNTFIRWVMLKEKASDEIAELITKFFLQQKIKPGEDETAKRVISAHKMLFYLVGVKQTVDLKVLNDFYEEWERFKLMFHIEGYSCKMEQIKLKKWAQKQKLLDPENQAKTTSDLHDQEDHHHDDHDHDDHEHTH